MWPVWEYLQKRKTTIVEYIATGLIFELCTGLDRMLGSSQRLIWWDQDYIQEGFNASNKGEEGEVEWWVEGSDRYVVFSLKCFSVSVP